jgi:hypothetical protein
MFGPADFRGTLRRIPKILQKQRPEKTTPQEETLSISSGWSADQRANDAEMACV